MQVTATTNLGTAWRNSESAQASNETAGQKAELGAQAFSSPHVGGDPFANFPLPTHLGQTRKAEEHETSLTASPFNQTHCPEKDKPTINDAVAEIHKKYNKNPVDYLQSSQYKKLNPKDQAEIRQVVEAHAESVKFFTSKSTNIRGFDQEFKRAMDASGGKIGGALRKYVDTDHYRSLSADDKIKVLKQINNYAECINYLHGGKYTQSGMVAGKGEGTAADWAARQAAQIARHEGIKVRKLAAEGRQGQSMNSPHLTPLPGSGIGNTKCP